MPVTDTVVGPIATPPVYPTLSVPNATGPCAGLVPVVGVELFGLDAGPLASVLGDTTVGETTPVPVVPPRTPTSDPNYPIPSGVLYRIAWLFDGLPPVTTDGGGTGGLTRPGVNSTVYPGGCVTGPLGGGYVGPVYGGTLLAGHRMSSIVMGNGTLTPRFDDTSIRKLLTSAPIDAYVVGDPVGLAGDEIIANTIFGDY